jgi:hypothetical protein
MPDRAIRVHSPSRSVQSTTPDRRAGRKFKPLVLGQNQSNADSYAGDIIVLAETLRDYGADAATPADLLRRFTSQTLHDIWPEDGAAPALADPRAGQILEHVR